MAALTRAGRPFAVATLVRTQGSTPQVVGARLVVTDDASERPFGTLGGGCVEADAIETARQVLRDGGRAIHVHQLNEELAWSTGLVCGGTMWILAESGRDAFACGERGVLADLAAAAAGGAPAAVLTLFETAGRAGMAFAGRVAVYADGQLGGSLGAAALDERARDAGLEQIRLGTTRMITLDDSHDLLVEPVARRPHLVVAGGGHVAKAIARQAQLLDFDVTILEDRPEFANPDRFGGATVVGGLVHESIASLDYSGQAYLVIATRGHKLDADCVLAAVRTGVQYIGLLGSRRKTVMVEEMLRAEGIDDRRIAVVRAPVGLDLGGRTPAEIALSVLAEITQLRYGGSGQPLSSRTSARAGGAHQTRSSTV
jgi:xanthine dehydrogenase accessory factor